MAAATFREMTLSLQQKEQFFHEVTQSLKSGRTLSWVFERMSGGRPGAIRQVARRMHGHGGPSISEFMAAAPRAFSVLDRDVAAGGEASGRLADAMDYLRAYYDTLHRARKQMISHLVYPVFLMHFGALVLSLPVAVTNGASAFFTQLAWLLGGFYFLFCILAVTGVVIVRTARGNATFDRVLRNTPIVGGVLVAVTGSRFAMVAAMLVRSGGGILMAIDRAGNACGSAALRAGAEALVPKVRAGGGLSDVARTLSAFPEPLERAFELGEQTGRLDDELLRVAETYTESMTARFAALAQWLPRLIYLAVVGVLAWMIIQYARGYLGLINDLMDGM